MHTALQGESAFKNLPHVRPNKLKKWRISAAAFRGIRTALVPSLFAIYLVIAMVLTSTHTRHHRIEPGAMERLVMSFDSHLHESEQIVTHFLQDPSAPAHLSSPLHHEEPHVENLMNDTALTAYIKRYHAHAMGFHLLGRLPLTTESQEMESRYGMIHFQWFLVHGSPILVTQDCSKVPNRHVYYSTRRNILHPLVAGSTMTGTKSNTNYTCDHAQINSESWKHMKVLVKRLGQEDQELRHRHDIVSLEFFARQDTLYFFQARSDAIHKLPIKLQNIIHAALHVESNFWTLVSTERLVNEESWVLIRFPQVTNSHTVAFKTPMTTLSYDTASSLCPGIPGGSDCPTEEMLTIEQDFPIRCVSVRQQKSSSTKKKDEVPVSIITVIGQWRLPTFETIIVRVDWLFGMGLVSLLVILKIFHIGQETHKNRFHAPLTVVIYLLVVVVFKCLKPNNAGIMSSEPIYTTFIDSYRTFVMVHPIDLASPLVPWSHIFTYWLEIAAWRSRSIQGVLFWYLCYEIIASYVNEYTHALEKDNSVRCARVSFIAAMKQYAVDDVIRAYLLPPFFVYLYLLPMLLWNYVSVYIVTPILLTH